MEALLLGDGSDDSLSEDDNAIGTTAPKVSATSTIKTTTTTPPLLQQQSKPEAKPTTSSSSIAQPRGSTQEMHAEAPPKVHHPPRAPLFPNNNLIMSSPPPPAPSVMPTSHPQQTQLLQQQASTISTAANHHRPTNRPSPQQQQQPPYFNHASSQLPPKPSAQPSPHRNMNMNTNNNNINNNNSKSGATNTKPPSSNNDPFDFDFNMIEPTPLAKMNNNTTTTAMGIPSTSTVHHHPQQPRMPSTTLPPPHTNSSRSTAAIINTNIQINSSHSNYPASKSTMPIIAPPPQQHQQQQHQSGLAPNINMNSMRPPQKQSSTASAASTTTSATTVPASNTAPQPIGKPHIKTDAERRKEQFLMFTRVLMKFLEQKDAPMHATARAVIKNCAERHRAKVPGYESLTSVMQSQLRQTVGEVYWKKSEALLVHILKQQKQRNASSGTSQQPPVGGRPAQPPIHGAAPHTATMQQPPPQQQPHPQQPQQSQHNKQPPILSKQPSSQVAIDNNKTKEPKISEEKKKKTPPTAKSKSIVPSAAAPPPTGFSTTKSPPSDSAKVPMPLTIPLPNNSIVTKTTTPTTKTTKKRPPKKKPAATELTKIAAQPKKSSTPIAAAAAAAATTATTGQHKKDEEIKQQVSNTSIKKVVNKPEIPRPTKIYEEWMEEVDHAVSYDMTTAMNLLSKENLSDVDLQEEQKQLLYGQRKSSMPPIVSPLSSSDFSASTTASSSWSTRNIISSRIAWALIRLPELETSKRADSVSPTVPTTDTCCPDKWYNEETAESSDPTLYLISEATQCYIRTILENAVVASRRRCNLDGMRLWHMQHTTTTAAKNTHPPLALRLGCNVRRQLALANGNAAKVSERLEEALARSSNKKRKSADDEDVVVPSWLEATSMGDLSKRVFVKDVAEEKRKEASHHATKFFAEYGGKFAGEPPFGRVPTENVLTLKDIMPSVADLASNKKRRMYASTRYRSLF